MSKLFSFPNCEYLKRFIIFTDVGEEIDDEVALLLLINSIINCDQSTNNIILTIVFTFGVPNSLTPSERFEKFKIYFPTWNTKLKDYDIRYIYQMDDLLKIESVHYDKVLQIAPLTGVPPKFLKYNTFGHWFLMGQFSIPCINTSASFDAIKNENLMEVFQEQQQVLKYDVLTEITSALCRSVPFTSRMIKSLPKHFKNEILKMTFRQFVGRVPTHMPYCYNVTLNVNYKTLIAYIKISPFLDFSYKMYKMIEKFKFILIIIICIIVQVLAIKTFTYFDETFYENMYELKLNGGTFNKFLLLFFIILTVDYSFKLCKIVHIQKRNEVYIVNGFYDNIKNKPDNCCRKEDIKKLLEMVQVVQFMTGELYLDSKLSFDSLSNSSEGFTKWRKIISYYECSLTPAYDLIAAFFMIESENMSKDRTIHLLNIKNNEELKDILEDFVVHNKNLIYHTCDRLFRRTVPLSDIHQWRDLI
jgi:hypothetical protein